jgi:MFS family permease
MDKGMAFRFSRTTWMSLYAPALLLAASNGLVVPALPVLAHSLSTSFALAALALASLLLGSALAAIPTGYMLDSSLGRRGVTITGLFLVALSGLLMMSAKSFPELILYQLLAGWGSQMWMLGRLTLIGVQSKVNERGRQISGMIGMEQMGTLLGPAIGGGITASFGASATFGVRGALCLAAALMVFFATRSPAKEQHQPKIDRGERKTMSLVQMLKTPPLLKLTGLQLVVSLARGSIFSGTFDLYLVYAYGVGPSTIGILRSVIGAVCLPITFWAGHAMDRFGRKSTIIPGFALVAIGLLAMAVVSGLGMPFQYFAGCLVIVHMSISLTAGSMQTLGIDLAPPEWSGRFLGFLRLGTEFGHFMSPMAFALVAKGLGYSAAFTFLSLTGASVSLIVAKAKWFPEKRPPNGK